MTRHEHICQTPCAIPADAGREWRCPDCGKKWFVLGQSENSMAWIEVDP